jgi:hypothetical protein
MLVPDAQRLRTDRVKQIQETGLVAITEHPNGNNVRN